MRNTFWLPILLAVTCCLADDQCERIVNGNVVTSSRDPKLQLRLPSSVRYVGGERWLLYGIADCELHVFVEGQDGEQVQRLYWLQFESYVASKPTLHYQYDSPAHTKLNGLDFYVDIYARPSEPRVGSDREHVERLLSRAGFRLATGMKYVRLVHLLNDTKRKELMIIYGEAKDEAQSDNALLDGAKKRITIEPMP